MGPILGQSNKQQIYCQFEGLVPKIVREVWLVLSNDAVVTLKNRSKFSKDLHAINFQSPVPSNFFPTNRVSHNSYYQYPGKSTTPCLFSTMLPGDQHRTVKKPSKKKPRANQSNTKKPHLLRNPSDPSILDLQLRSLSKNQDLQPMEAKGWSRRDGVLMCIYRFIYFILYMNIMVYVFL